MCEGEREGKLYSSGIEVVDEMKTPSTMKTHQSENLGFERTMLFINLLFNANDIHRECRICRTMHIVSFCRERA